MPMNVNTSAGSILSLATLPTLTGVESEDLTAYAAASWLEIAEITNIGDFGREYNVTTFNPLGDRKTYKLKGSYDDGSFTIEMGRNVDSEGQQMLKEALNSDNAYAVRVVTQGERETFYMPVKVTSAPISIGGVDDVTSSTANLEVDGDVISPDATPVVTP